MEKYKLINSVTKIETLCDKVTIDGFDYYVSDEETKWAIDETNKLVNLWFYPEKLKGFVLATNNPNIDIPQVVDEVERLFWKILNSETPQSRDELLLEATKHGFKFGYNKSQETHPFSEEDMIEFAEWCENLQKDNKEIRRSNPSITTKELLQIWKEQRPKIVYYG